jgi:ADP-ribosyl-[dinitrogen reductase] hydrolase
VGAHEIDQKVVNRARGCLLGLAVGDAVGTAVEFQRRGTFEPITDMIGGGPFGLNPGEWTDDTSMALCLAVSLLESNGFDSRDQMDRYWRWYEKGYLSSNGRCFDIGNTIRYALHQYRATGNPIAGPSAPDTAGNGSIMRLAPVPLFCYPDRRKTAEFSIESSRTTHGAQECLDACRLLGDIIHLALTGADKESVLFRHDAVALDSPSIARIAEGAYRSKRVAEIRGTGYVVDSLEAALWCFWHSATFEEAILKATNLGDDADTTAAVCGQVAGAYYGESDIPKRWLQRLVMRGEIKSFAEKLVAALSTDR